MPIAANMPHGCVLLLLGSGSDLFGQNDFTVCWRTKYVLGKAVGEEGENEYEEAGGREVKYEEGR
jgi:hypothetical protein